jgi:acyl carrier protein
METLIREILREQGDLSVPVDSLASDASLFDAGLSSFGSVEVMVALEDRLGVTFPEHLLRRSTFETIAGLSRAAEELRAVSVGA